MSEINGMIRAANALHYWERRQEIAAHNLANVDTAGFKAERVFARLVADNVSVVGTATDRRAGSMRPTGAPLDLALGGENDFLVVGAPGGERLTRGGSYSLDPEGRIVDARGNPLLAEGGGAIVVPQGASIEIDARGVVQVDGKEAGQLRVERMPAGIQLVHEEGTLIVPDGASTPVAPEERQVRQGFLEESNVSAIGSLVDLISIQRNFAAVQRTVTTLDSIRGTIVNDLGRPV